MKTKSLDTILAFALVLIVASSFAHTWQQATTLTSAGATAMSADGRIICVVNSATHPYVSTDSGKTWTLATNSPPRGSPYVGGLAISADGSKIFATLSTNTSSRSWIFMSPDQGTNWVQTAFPSTTISTNYCVACSADGTKVIASLRNGPIFYSTNGGVNCYISSVPNAAWSSLASSADGSRMFAAANVGSGVYFSSDFGATWTSANPLLSGCSSVCTSSDGKWVGAINNSTYISSNGGATWRTNNLSGGIIACSADGTNWIIAGNHIYTSADAGATWTTNLSFAQWLGGAVSADGSEMVAVGSGQGTWIGRVTPSPQLNIQSQDSNVAVSWLLPSTNFVLQQSADLTTPSWTPVSPSPTLNFTNLQQQVTVPTTGSNAFFRLIAQ